MDHVQTSPAEIAELRTQLENLQTSEEKYRAIFNYSHDAIVLVHPENNQIIDANPRACEMLGYSYAELLNQPISAIHPDDMNELNEFVSRVFKDGNGWTNEISCRAQNGRTLPSEMSASVVNIDGQRYVIVMLRDISERKETENVLRTLNEELETMVGERTNELQASNAKLQTTLKDTIYAMSKIVELRDPYTAGHQQRVAELARVIATEMALPDETIEGIYMIGLIHDIGKIKVPAEILGKPGRLTELEFAMIKEHPQIGADIMWNVNFSWPVSQIILQHHERLDGSGYPKGLKGEQIELEARILSVADVIDAICSHRPYRAAYPVEVALDELRDNKGILYDEKVVEAALAVFESGFGFD